MVVASTWHFEKPWIPLFTINKLVHISSILSCMLSTFHRFKYNPSYTTNTIITIFLSDWYLIVTIAFANCFNIRLLYLSTIEFYFFSSGFLHKAMSQTNYRSSFKLLAYNSSPSVLSLPFYLPYLSWSYVWYGIDDNTEVGIRSDLKKIYMIWIVDRRHKKL